MKLFHGIVGLVFLVSIFAILASTVMWVIYGSGPDDSIMARMAWAGFCGIVLSVFFGGIVEAV